MRLANHSHSATVNDLTYAMSIDSSQNGQQISKLVI